MKLAPASRPVPCRYLFTNQNHLTISWILVISARCLRRPQTGTIRRCSNLLCGGSPRSDGLRLTDAGKGRLIMPNSSDRGRSDDVRSPRFMLSRSDGPRLTEAEKTLIQWTLSSMVGVPTDHHTNFSLVIITAQSLYHIRTVSPLEMTLCDWKSIYQQGGIFFECLLCLSKPGKRLRNIKAVF